MLHCAVNISSPINGNIGTSLKRIAANADLEIQILGIQSQL